MRSMKRLARQQVRKQDVASGRYEEIAENHVESYALPDAQASGKKRPPSGAVNFGITKKYKYFFRLPISR